MPETVEPALLQTKFQIHINAVLFTDARWFLEGPFLGDFAPLFPETPFSCIDP
jgi:hypothetical protein